MLAAPLFPVAVGIIVGIVADEVWRPRGAWYIAVFALSSTLIFIRGARQVAGPLLIGLASMGIGGMLHLHAARTPSPSSIERYVGERQRLIRVRGVVADEPRLLGPPPTEFQSWTTGSDRTVFLLDLDRLEGELGDITASGRLRVTVGQPLLDLRQGEHVEVFGWMYAFQPPANPGSFDWASFNRRQGIAAGLLCDQRENVRRTGSGRVDRASWIDSLRTRLRGLLTDDLASSSEAEASLLEAMILGHRSRLDRQINEVFVRAGCVHFLAVSGIHLVILMFFARLACQLLRGGPRACAWSMIAAVLFYAAVAEPRPPILRASVIALIYCIALLLGRERACVNWISATVIILAIVDPGMVFDLGYQLSTAAVLGVSYLSLALRGAAAEVRGVFETRVLRRPFAAEDRRLARSVLVPPGMWGRGWRRVWNWTGRWFSTGLAISFGAWLAGLPIIAVYFLRIQPWGAPSSLIALPLVSLAMLMGFVKLAAAAVAPTLGSWVTVVLTHADAVLMYVVERLSRLPGANASVSPPPWWVFVAYYAFLLALVWRFHRDSRYESFGVKSVQASPAPRHRAPDAALATATLFLFIAAAVWARSMSHTGRLIVTMLSVGAGSATVIELPDGRTVVVDAGSSTSQNTGANAVVPFLRHRGIRRIDRLYVRHPNLDHFSAVPTLIDEMSVGPIMINEYFKGRSTPSSPSRHLLKVLTARGHPIEEIGPAPSSWAVGDVRFELLWPPSGLGDAVTANDTSMVLRISFAGRSMLLTGDLEDYAQRSLLARGDLHADVLVLPHHGSVRPSSAAFIQAVGPSVAVRSSHERSDETISGIEVLVGEATLFNTADVGAVQVIVTPRASGLGSFTVSAYREGVTPVTVLGSARP